MNPYFILAVVLGVFSRSLGYCPVCKHYRILQFKGGEKQKTCDVCGSELKPFKKT